MSKVFQKGIMDVGYKKSAEYKNEMANIQNAPKNNAVVTPDNNIDEQFVLGPLHHLNDQKIKEILENSNYDTLDKLNEIKNKQLLHKQLSQLPKGFLNNFNNLITQLTVQSAGRRRKSRKQRKSRRTKRGKRKSRRYR